MSEMKKENKKSEYKIGQVSRMLDLESYVLRYWETEFPQLKPEKSPKGQRIYRKKDIELLEKIKHLLYERKFTISGAREALGSSHDKQTITAKQDDEEVIELLKNLKSKLESLQSALRKYERN